MSSLSCVTILRLTALLLWLQDFERSRAFNFLNEIKKRFQTTYGSRAQTALPYAMNSEFSSLLAAQMVQKPAQRMLHIPQTGYCPYSFPHLKNVERWPKAHFKCGVELQLHIQEVTKGCVLAAVLISCKSQLLP